MNSVRYSAFVVAGLLTFLPANAQHAGDIGLGVQSNRIVTGTFDNGAFIPGARVFKSDFGELLPNFADEPGFDNLPGTFAPGSSIGFTILAPLKRWDGADFDTLPPERLQIGFASITPALTPTNAGEVEGFALAVAANGEWHRHWQHILLDPAGEGIYLLEVKLWSTQPELESSAPFWIVFNQLAPESDHNDAAAWVDAHLAGGGGGTGSACNPADIAAVGDVGQPQDTGPDGQLTVDDLLVFVNLFSSGDPCPGAAPCSRADMAGVGGPPEPPDGQLTVDDLIAFVNAFIEGC